MDDLNEKGAGKLAPDEVLRIALRAARYEQSRRYMGSVGPEDVAQAAAVKFLESQERDSILRPEAYLRSMTRRLWIDETRRAERREFREASFDAWSALARDDDLDTTHNAAIARVTIEELTELAKSELSERQQQAFQALVESGGHIPDAIQALTQEGVIKEGAARTHLTRAITKLRAKRNLLAHSVTPEQRASRLRMVEAIREADLTEVQSRRINMLLEHGLTLAEIAKREGTSSQAVRKSTRSAMAKIDAKLNER